MMRSVAGHADVGRDQQLFERLERLDVDRPRPALGRVGAADDVVEAVDDLLLGAGEAVANPAEDTHRRRSYSRDRSRSSARCGRSISASTAARTSDAALEHRRHLRRDRQLDAVAARRAPAPRRSSCTPSATIFMPATTSARRRPRASSMPTWRLRLSVPVQVSTRSPSPLSPAGVSRRPPAAHASRVISARPARDERRQRVVAEPEPFDDARRDRDDVLHRAADLDADDVGRSVEPEVRPAELRLHQLASPDVSLDAASTAVGSCCATSTAKLGPDSTTTGRSLPELLLDHLRHPQQRVGLEPLRRADDRGTRLADAAPPPASPRGSRATGIADTTTSMPSRAGVERVRSQ